MSTADDAHDRTAPLKIDTTVPHSARFWNYWLGGDDWYPVDKELGDALREEYPAIAGIAVASREFLGRAVRHLARDVGVRQFLDVGSGLPTAENTHQVAQRYAPDSRIVYADTDPTVLLHSQALLTSTPEGATTYLDADVMDVDVMLERAGADLDLEQPVALMLLSMLGHIEPDPAAELVQEYMRRLPSGSYLVTCDSIDDPVVIAVCEDYAAAGAAPYYPRSKEQLAATAAGLDLLPPGLGPIARWRPDHPEMEPPQDQLYQWGLVARKP
ncbi:hypothetical protein SUDANB171_00106 [Streptomyces sp. enrichment culture]|jgi:hypothetical protein|uniref:SAM-dependent methyltransferase n=1 Tax=Streptomyces xiamenensis TaxID=408015 RepID=UPI0036DFD7EB